LGVAGLQPPEHLDVAVVNNRDIGDGALRRNRMDGCGGCLGGPDEILVGIHSRRAVDRNMRNAVEAVLGAKTAFQRKLDHLG
jgi:hypothetical protein